MDQEEQALLKEEPYVFENTGDGWFYLVYETRPYVRAKYASIKALSEVGAFLATELALKEAKKLLYLNRGDDMAVRDVVQGLLGRMQEAYDYIRFWADPSKDIDCGDGDGEDEDEEEGENEDENEGMEEDEAEKMPPSPGKSGKGKTQPTRREITGVVPCFKDSGADMTEPLDMFIRPRVPSVFHKCALTYIKMMVAHALTGAIRKLRGADEAEKAQVLEFLAQSSLPSDHDALREVYTKVFDQAVKAFRLTRDHNNQFWGGETAEVEGGRVEGLSAGSTFQRVGHGAHAVGYSVRRALARGGVHSQLRGLTLTTPEETDTDNPPALMAMMNAGLFEQYMNI